MAKLLVLSLTETTREKDGYEVIAINIEDKSWIIIPKLPRSLLVRNGEIAWDIFGVTEADIKVNPYSRRSQVFEVITDNYLPKMVNEPIVDNKRRMELLESIASTSVNELDSNSNWVGLLKDCDITEILFREKPGIVNPNKKRTFYWECRINFTDVNGDCWSYNTAPGIACKDMRFKAYWKDLFNRDSTLFEAKKLKWLDYLKLNYSYLLIEFIPNEYYGTIAMVSGIFCIKREEVL
jgi:hypothetical protein